MRKTRVNVICGFIDLLLVAVLSVLIIDQSYEADFALYELVKDNIEVAYVVLLSAIVVVSVVWLTLFGILQFLTEAGKCTDGLVDIRTAEEKENDLEVREEKVEEKIVEEKPSKVKKVEKVEEVKVEEINNDILDFYKEEPKQAKKQTKKSKKNEAGEQLSFDDVIVNEEKEEEAKTYEEPVFEPKEYDSYIGLNKTTLVNFELFEGNTVKVGKNWLPFLNAEKAKKNYAANMKVIKDSYEEEDTSVYPSKQNILKAFEYCDFDNVRVVIIGKIPYYRMNQADGLAFSTSETAKVHQSTNVIINEAIQDVKIAKPSNGSLANWGKHGVLLLNTVLTARNDRPSEHTENWEQFTTSLLKEVIKDSKPKVFILWGEHAQTFEEEIRKHKQHYVISAPNPSPLSAANGFYNSKPFSKANAFLLANGYEAIDWELK